MHQKDRDSGGVSSPDYDSALCEQQTVLLHQIDILTRDAAINNPPKSGYIYTLKQEYNLLVKKRAELVGTSLLDPIDVLPSDLWPDIIRNTVSGPQYYVNKLLELISVSRAWCSLLTTLPVIWTQIRLDQREPDYFAKAMMCIHLSGECEIDLTIWCLTAEEWRKISCMIVPEGRRIRRLSFIDDGTDYTVTWLVLEDFTKLPVLRELFLPGRPSPLSDQEYIHALLTEKMPSIKTVNAPGCALQHQMWNPYLTHYSLQAESLTREAVETLMLLPHLRHLTFVETAQTLENIPSPLKSSFGSLTDFTYGYGGADICRRLTWIGNNLSILSTHYPENGDASAFLAALSQFPHLHKLTITISSTIWGQETQKKSHIASPHNSIRVLQLEAFVQDQHGADWDVFFLILFPTSPCLEILGVRFGLITDMGWNSIQSITNLRDLQIFACSMDDSSSIPLNMGSLRNFQLTVGPHGLVQALARLQSKFLQTLRLREPVVYPIVTTTTPCIAAGAAFPNITSLVISTRHPIILELKALSKLRTLKIRPHAFGNKMIYWVNNVLAAILMRPRDTPALEKITIACDFIEWDILILMLERRNFLNEPGISSIKTLVLNRDLPYRLLYPLSELLGGSFVERDSNYSFSLEAIGERMWNESIPGCMQCHHSLRECESSLIKRSKIPLEEATGGNKEYNLALAHEHLVADPPLPLEMMLWLSGRRDRLTDFLRRSEETGRQWYRPSSCDASKSRQRESIITADVLAGAHFVSDLQEYDAGVDA